MTKFEFPYDIGDYVYFVRLIGVYESIDLFYGKIERIHHTQGESDYNSTMVVANGYWLKPNGNSIPEFKSYYERITFRVGDCNISKDIESAIAAAREYLKDYVKRKIQSLEENLKDGLEHLQQVYDNNKENKDGREN